MTRADLISPEYQAEQVILHAAPRGYGGKGNKWEMGVRDLVTRYACVSVLDYGCGEGALVRALHVSGLLGVRLAEYDPAIPGKDSLPDPADLVVCTDVLEHIEPGKLSAVLLHLKSLARMAILVVIATRPSGKILTDGRNAHLILENDEWWETVLETAGFRVLPGPKSPSRKPSREFVAVLRP